MKKIFFILSFFLLENGIYAQSPTQNFMKYWAYRYRLRHEFVKAGEQNYICQQPGPYHLATGMSIPASIVNSEPINSVSNPNGRTMHWGDATTDLGWYIAVLATEYTLLSNSGQSTDKTAEELYYAMKAFERLDYHCEENFTPASGCIDLNGFFGRDDVTKEFVSQYFPNYTLHNSDYNANMAGGDFSYGMYGSQDQVMSLWLGFSMIVRGIPPSASYNGYNFVCNAQKNTARMASYMSSNNYTIPIPGTDDGTGKPYYIATAADTKYNAYGLAKAAEHITANSACADVNWNGTPFEGSNPLDATQLYYGLWEGYQTPTGLTGLFIDQTGAINDVLAVIDDILDKPMDPVTLKGFRIAMTQTIAAMGNSWYEDLTPTMGLYHCFTTNYGLCFNFSQGIHFCTKQICVGWECYDDPGLYQIGLSIPSGICGPAPLPTLPKINTTAVTLSNIATIYSTEIYPLIHQYLYNSGNYLISNSTYTGMINSAPCSGNFYYPNNNGTPGWRINNRFTNQTKAESGDPNLIGDFNGLDFMLLYNLYSLVQGTGIPSFQNKLFADYGNVNYPQGSTGTDANPVVLEGFETLTYSGVVNSGSTSATNGNVTLRAGDQITLNPGFSIQPGAHFVALAQPLQCTPDNSAYQRLAAQGSSTIKDTALIQKQTQEYIKSAYTKMLQENAGKIADATTNARYVPVDEYIKNAEINYKNQVRSNAPQVNIYPNPVISNFTIEFGTDQNQSAELRITDAAGKFVRQYLLNPEITASGISSININCADLPPGIYLYNFYTTTSVQKGKLIKIQQQ